MSGGSRLRKELEARIGAALTDRGYRRQRPKDKERYRRSEGMEPPLVAQLLVSVDTDRYGLVRLAGSVQIVCPSVDEAFESAPDDALTSIQKIYRGRLQHELAGESFGKLRGVPAREQQDWVLDDESRTEEVLAEFFAFLDGPARDWFKARSTVESVRAAVDSGEGVNADAVRNMCVLDVLLGRRDSAVGRVERYAAHPEEKVDSPEQVEAFRQWLETVEPLHRG